MISCEQRFDNAKSCSCRVNCPVVLSDAVCFCYRCYVLIGSTGVICVMGKKQGAVTDQIHVEKEKRRKKVHHNTYDYTRARPTAVQGPCYRLPRFAEPRRAYGNL